MERAFIKELVKRLVPPILADVGRVALGRAITFRGGYATWEDARRHSRGYEDRAILDRVIAATAAVRDERAAFERDGTTFMEPRPPFPILAILLMAALRQRARLKILDFGGALGSLYFQSRSFLGSLERLTWSVVEQPHFVEVGRREFADGVLGFYDTIDDACKACPPDVAILSGVLQYLPDPGRTLRSVAAYYPRFIVIDRTPLTLSGAELIAIQRVPEPMGPASFPVWLFSRRAVIDCLARDYRIIAEFDAVDGIIGFGRHRSRFRGFAFELRPDAHSRELKQ